MARYQLASSTLYPGLFTDNVTAMREFYVDLGLRFMEKLPQSETYAELFFELPGGKLKIQADTSGPMPPAVSGYQGLLIARDEISDVVTVTDPDGLGVQLVPHGHRGVTSVGFAVDVPDEAAYRRFLTEGMAAKDNEHGPRVGDTQFLLTENPGREHATPICRRGFTYITLIVHDTVATQRALVEAGGQDSLDVARLHDRCLFSFVRDPFGNWIEIVQYANLSGPVPTDVRAIEDHLDRVVPWREEAVPF